MPMSSLGISKDMGILNGDGSRSLKKRGGGHYVKMFKLY